MNDNRKAVILADATESAKPKEEISNETVILALLTQLGNGQMDEDQLVFEGKRFVLPEMYNGKVDEAIRFLRAHQKQMEEEHDFDRTFKYRENDVAAALMRALHTIWGTTGIGQAQYSFFGKINPRFKSIEVGVGQTLQVPAEVTAFPPLEATIYVGSTNDKELGALGFMRITAPRKYRYAVEGLFTAIEAQLKTGSIYRGKAITGSATPGFIDTSTVNPADVVYTDEVMRQLEANLWVLIEHTEKMKEMGVPLKRAILLEGPYGTGKTLAGMLTAQKSEQNQWTYIATRPGDDLDTTMRTAQLYAPAVVFFEDVDTIASTDDPEKISKLLDTFDGITAKGVPVIGVLTTNNVQNIHKGMLRPGRMDAVISIGHLDRNGVKKLVEATIGSHLLMDIDWDEVFKAYEGFLPAFVKEAVGRAQRYGIARLNGDQPEFYTTTDLVDAAHGLRPQLDLMNGAKEAEKLPTLDQAFRETISGMVEQVMDSSEVQDRDGDKVFDLAVSEQD